MRVNIRLFGIGVLLVGLVLSGALPLNPAKAAVLISQAPAALALSPIPTKLPADNNTYPGIVVSVVDGSGKPTAALADINVSLTSSQENVGTITARVAIHASETYAIANFTTTHTAGSTTVTATTTGLATASTVVTTVVAVGYPTHLVITAVPDTVPASTASTGNLILELEDDVGLPAKAIADVPISLYSSNTNVINVTAATSVMAQGEYLKEVNYTSGFVPGSAVITASASGFASGISTVSVLGSPPLALKLQAQPNAIAACSGNVTSCSGRLVVVLTDLKGNPTLATSNIGVQIRSSNLVIVNTSETAVIQEGDISTVATFTAVGHGGAVVTASAPGLQSSFVNINVQNATVVDAAICISSPTACQLAISAGPNPVLADHRSYSSVVVSLESGGVPVANYTGPTEVTLTSSVTGVGNFTQMTFPIPEGQTWAAVTFTSTYQVGMTQLTASAQNFLPVQTVLNTYGAVPSQVVLRAISTPLPADGTSHPALELALEDAFGSPAIAASDVPVNLSSSQGDVVGVADAVIPAGQTFAIVNVAAGILQGEANITAQVSSFTTGYASSSTNLSTVIPAPSSLSAFAPNAGVAMLTSSASSQSPLVAVQLQDSAGNPARARAPMNITVTSSNSTVSAKVLTVVIGVGQDYGAFPLAANASGLTTLTFSTPGLSTTSVRVTFLSYPNVATITGGPKSILTNQTAIISVSLALDGTLLQGAHVHWNATSGGLVIATPHTTNSSVAAATSTTTSTKTSTMSTVTRSTTTVAPVGLPAVNDTTDVTGSSIAIFHPTRPGLALITAVVASAGFPTKTLNFTVQVNAAAAAVGSANKHKASLIQELTTFPLLLVPVGGAGGAVAAVFLIRKRRSGGGAKGDDEFGTSFE